MKKIVCMIFALALIFALVGCTATNRAYRRYTDPSVTDNRTYTAKDGVYRRAVRPSTILPGETPRLKTAPRTATGNAAIPTPTTGTTTTPRGTNNRTFNVPS